jgi:hypothetical protein
MSIVPDWTKSRRKHRKPFDISSVSEDTRKAKALFTGTTLDGFIEAAKSLSLDELVGVTVDLNVTPKERAALKRLKE